MYADGVHPNALGNQHTAEYIAEQLKLERGAVL
jgi:lysophospholipase L1-like esterase